MILLDMYCAGYYCHVSLFSQFECVIDTDKIYMHYNFFNLIYVPR